MNGEASYNLFDNQFRILYKLFHPESDMNEIPFLNKHLMIFISSNVHRLKKWNALGHPGK